MFTIRQCWVATLLLGAVTGVQATDIYRWVDKQGHTHWSDVVPDEYKDSAKHIDSRQYELTPEQKREAEERAAREKTNAPSLPEPQVTGAPSGSAPVSPSPVVKRPIQRVTTSTDCTTWWRLFRESQECFGPFHTVGGGIKPEAFEQCNEVPSPEVQCGPSRN